VIPNLGCLGGRREHAFNYTINEGVTSLDKYPYENANGECKYEKEKDMVFQIDHFKVYENMINDDLWKLVCQGAVSASFRINDCIKNY